MPRALVLFLGLTGCDVVYGFPDRPVDAPSDPACWNAALTDDEDGDTSVNGCDFCPAFAATEKDTDGDRILDPCDPDSSAQQLVDFAGFVREMDGDGWAGGSWQATMGLFGQFDPTARQMARKAIPPTVNPSIEAPIVFNPTHDIGASAGVGFDLGSVAVTCRYEFADGSDKVILDFGGVPLETRYDAGPGLRLRLFQSTDGVLHCQAFDATAASSIVESVPLLDATTVLATLETNKVITSYAWVMIIGADSPTR